MIRNGHHLVVDVLRLVAALDRVHAYPDLLLVVVALFLRVVGGRPHFGRVVSRLKRHHTGSNNQEA